MRALGGHRRPGYRRRVVDYFNECWLLKNSVGGLRSDKTAWGRRTVDLSSLAELGKIAGLAGVAIGMIVLLVRPIIDRASSLPEAQRGPMFRLIAIGAFAVGAVGIVDWAVAGITIEPAVTNGGRGVATNGPATNNALNCEERPAEADQRPAEAKKP